MFADVLCVLCTGFTGISATVSMLTPESAIPRWIGWTLIIVCILSLLLTIFCTLVFIRCDRQLFLIDLKLADIKLAEAGAKDAYASAANPY